MVAIHIDFRDICQISLDNFLANMLQTSDRVTGTLIHMSNKEVIDSFQITNSEMVWANSTIDS